MHALRASLFAVMLAVPAGADTVADLRADLGALTGAVAELARELSSGAATAQPGYDGPLLDRVDRMEAVLADLTGRIEQLEFRIRRAIDDASNRLGDLEFRLTELEGGSTEGLSPPALGQPVTDSAQPQLAAGEQRAFEDAMALAATEQPEAAAAALTRFIDTYPGSPLGAEASFKLAELNRALGREPDAARAYLNLYMAAPDGPDAPRALLALGESLGRLDQAAEACAMFDELRSRFPGSDEATRSKSAGAQFDCP